MLAIVANVDHITFDIENAIEQQIGTQSLPFPGMDKSNAAVCTFFQHNTCAKGYMCPFRHVRGEKQIVCKHWLRGLCKKGDECEFLHQYDMTKMPECFFFSRFGMCNNKDCPFLHIDPDSKIKDCPWYDRGFCKHGPSCKNRHVRRVMCQNYLNGFCLDGPQCKFQHPAFEEIIPAGKDNREFLKRLICHFCGEAGHKIANCPQNPNANDGRMQIGAPGRTFHSTVHDNTEYLKRLICHFCGEAGHKIAACPKNPSATEAKTQPGVPGKPFNLTGHDNTDYLKRLVCHFCGEAGHKIAACPKKLKEQVAKTTDATPLRRTGFPTTQLAGSKTHVGPLQTPFIPKEYSRQLGGNQRNFDNIKCFRCGEMGHIALNCTQEDKRAIGVLSSNFPS